VDTRLPLNLQEHDVYKGFVYEFDVISRLTIEGRIIDVQETSTEADRRVLARKIIDESLELANRTKQTEIQKGLPPSG
jgi:hypothetical protein